MSWVIVISLNIIFIFFVLTNIRKKAKIYPYKQLTKVEKNNLNIKEKKSLPSSRKSLKDSINSRVVKRRKLIDNKSTIKKEKIKLEVKSNKDANSKKSYKSDQLVLKNDESSKKINKLAKSKYIKTNNNKSQEKQKKINQLKVDIKTKKEKAIDIKTGLLSINNPSYKSNHGILDKTYIHINGIGTSKEEGFWSNGCLDHKTYIKKNYNDRFLKAILESIEKLKERDFDFLIMDYSQKMNGGFMETS